jgi:hypothetical protein
VNSLVTLNPDVNLTLSGDLTVKGICSISGSVNVYARDTMTFYGKANIGGQLTLVDGVVKSSSAPGMLSVTGKFSVEDTSYYWVPTLDGVQMTVSGGIDWTEAGSQSINLQNGASIFVPGGSQFNMSAGKSINGGTNGNLHIEGSMNCKGKSSSDFCLVNCNFVNSGSVVVTQASLGLSTASKINGSVSVSDGRLELSGTHVFDISSSLTVNGSFAVTRGTTVVSSLVLQLQRIEATGYRYSNADLKVVLPPGADYNIQSISSEYGSITVLYSGERYQLNVGNVTLGYSGSLDTYLKTNISRLVMNYQSGVLTSRLGVAVLKSFQFNGGRLSGPGVVDLYGLTEINYGGSALYLDGLDLTLYGTLTFNQTSTSLSLSSGSHMTISQTGIASFAASGCRITESGGSLDNFGLIKSESHLTGSITISVGTFNNFGRVIVSSHLKTTLRVQSSGLLDGSYEVGDGNVLILASKVLSSPSALVKGSGTLQSTGSPVRISHLLVKSLLVSGGTFEIPPSLEKANFTVDNITVTGGQCIINPVIDQLKVDKISVSGGSLSLAAVTNINLIEIKGGTIITTFPIQVNEISWSGGTFIGVKGQQTIAAKFSAYLSLTKSLRSAEIRVTQYCQLRGYGMTISMEDGSSLEISPNATADVIGTDITLTSYDASGSLINHGYVKIFTDSFVMSLPLRNLGTIEMLNGNVRLYQSSSNDGDIVVSGNSTFTLSNSLSTSLKSSISGDGSLILSSSSNFELMQVSVTSITITSGKVSLSPYSSGGTLAEITYLEVRGGEMDLRDTAIDYGQPGDKSIQINRIRIVGSGRLVSRNPVEVGSLSLVGGVLECHRNVTVSNYLLFGGGTVLGNAVLLPQIWSKGRTEFVNSNVKTLSSISFYIMSSATWRGYGDISVRGGSLIHIARNASFILDTTASITSDGGGNRLINEGILEVGLDQVVTVQTHVLNHHEMSVQTAGSLIFTTSTSFTRGFIALGERSVVSFNGGDHWLPSGATLRGSQTSVLQVAGGEVLCNLLTFSGNLRISNGLFVAYNIQPGLKVAQMLLSGSGNLIINDHQGAVLAVGNVTVSSSSSLTVNVFMTVQQLQLLSGRILGSGHVDATTFLWQQGSVMLSSINATDLDIVGSSNKYLYNGHFAVLQTGTWEGTGTLYVTDGGNLELTAGSEISIVSTMLLQGTDGGFITNSGAIRHNPALELPGYLTVDAFVINHGTISALGNGGLILIQDIHCFGVLEVSSENSTIEIRSGTGTIYESAKIIGKGTIKVQGGQFNIQSSQANIGQIQVPGGSIILSNKLINASLTQVSISRRGSLYSYSHLTVSSLFVSGGTIELSAPSKIRRANVTGGVLSSQTKNVTIGTLIWYGGYLSGSGAIVVDTGTIPSSTASKYLADHTTLIFRKKGEMIGGPLSLYLRSSSTVINAADSIFTFNDRQTFSDNGYGTTAFVNYGKVEIRAVLSTVTLDTDFRNRGKLSVWSGTLKLTRKGSNDGTFEIKANASLLLSGSISSHPTSLFSGDGSLLVSSGRTTCVGCVFNLTQITVTSGTLVVDSFNDTNINSVNQRGGLISVSQHSGLLAMQHVSLFGGTMQTSGSVVFQRQISVSGGYLRLNDDVQVKGTLIWEGGTIASVKAGYNKAKMRVRTLIIDDSATVSYYSRFPTKVIQSVELIVQSSGIWKTLTTGTVQLSSRSRMEIAAGAVFDVFVGERVTLTYGSFLNRGTTRFIGTEFQSTSTVIGSTVESLGSIVIDGGNSLTLQAGLLCSGDVQIGNLSSLTLQGSITTSECLLRGNRLFVPSGSSVTVQAEKVNIEELEVAGSFRINGSISLSSLKVAGGSVVGEGNHDTRIEVSNLFNWNGGTIQSITLETNNKSEVAGSASVRSSKLRFGGDTNFSYSITAIDSSSSLSFLQGSSVTFLGLCTMNGVSSTSGTVINEGTIKLQSPGSSLISNVPVYQQGILVAGYAQTRVQLYQSDNASLGILQFVGDRSELIIKGTTAQTSVIDSASSFCTTCKVTFNGGLLKLKPSRTSPVKLPYLNLQQGRLVADASSVSAQVELVEVAVTGSSTLSLSSSVVATNLLLNGGQVAINGHSRIQKLLFIGGDINGNISASLESDEIIVMTTNRKLIKACKTVVKKILIVTQANLNLQDKSSLVIAKSATAEFSGTSLQIIGQTRTSVDGGLLENKGVCRVRMEGGRRTSFAVYFVNTGIIEVTSGVLTLSGNSQISGTIESQGVSSIELTANSHNVLRSTSLAITGVLRISGSSTSVVLDTQKTSLDTVLVQSGVLTVSATLCMKHLDIAGGTVKTMSAVGLDSLMLTSGTLDAHSDVDVNGLATWSGGKIDKSPKVSVRFNGPTAITAGLTGAPNLTYAGASCSKKSSCSNCLADSDCVWYDGSNVCLRKSVYSGNSGTTCKSWITAVGKCPANLFCSRFQTAENCNRSSQCAFCDASQSCESPTSSCSSTTLVYWSSDSSGTWYRSYPQYWSTGIMPNQSHDVYIAKAVSVTINYASQSVKSLTVGSSSLPSYKQPSLTISRTLTISDSLTVKRGATIVIQSSLSVSGSVKIDGTVVWNYGTVSGGSWVVGGLLRVTTSNSRTLNSDVNLLGQMTWESGRVTLGSGKTLNVSSSANLSVYQSGSLSGSSTVLSGSFTVLPGVAFTVSSRVNSTGNITVLSGSQLYLNDAGTISGLIYVYSDYSSAAVYVTGQTAVLSDSCEISGTGRLGIRSGKVTIHSSLNRIKELYINGGSVTLSKSQLLQSFTLERGSISASQSVTVEGRSFFRYGTLSGSTFTLLGPAIFQLSRYSRYGLTLTDARLILSGDSVTAQDHYYYYYYSNSYYRYYSTFYISGSGKSQLTVDSNATLSVTYINYFDVRGMNITNKGSVICACAGSCRFQGGLDNLGSLVVMRGSVAVTGGMNSYSGSLVQIHSGTSLSLNSGATVFYSFSMLDIQGTLYVNSVSQTVTIRSNFTACKRIYVQSGTLDMKTVSGMTIGRLETTGSSSRAFVSPYSSATGSLLVNVLSASSSGTVQLLGNLRLPYVRLSSGILQMSTENKVDIGYLYWTAGRMQGLFSWKSGVVQTKQVVLSGYYSKEIRNVRLQLTKSFYDSYNHGTTLTLKDTFVTIPSSSKVVFTVSSLAWRTSGQSLVLVEGGLMIKGVKGTGGNFDVQANLDCPGSLSILEGSLTLRFSSNITGNVTVQEGAVFQVADGTHVWSGFLNSSGDIRAIGGNPTLTIRGTAYLSSVSVSRGTTTLDVSPQTLVLQRLSVSSSYYYYRSYYTGYTRFYCQQNCSVYERVYWTGGYLGAIQPNATMTVSNTGSIYISGSYYKYSTSNKLVIDGTVYVEGGNIQLSGQLEISHLGRMEVLNSIGLLGSTSSLHNQGVITVHHGVTLTLSSVFSNAGRIDVYGSVRVSSGTTSGHVNLKDSGSSFVAQRATYSLTKTATIGGIGNIRVERGTLIVECDVGNRVAYDGRFDVAGGTLQFNGLSGSNLNASSLLVRGGTFRLSNARNSVVGSVAVTRGTMQVRNCTGAKFSDVSVSGYGTYIDTDSQIVISTTFLWGYRGTIKGGGTVFISGHMNVYSNEHYITGATVVTAGSATIGGSGNFYMSYLGKLIVPQDASLTILSSRSFTYSGRRGRLENAGVILLKGHAANVYMNIELRSNGSVVIEKGLLTVYSANVDGLVLGYPGTKLTLSGTTTLTKTSKLLMADSDVVSSGTVSIESSHSTALINSLIVTSGTLKVNSVLGTNVAGDLSVTSGTLQVFVPVTAGRLMFRGGTISQGGPQGMLSVDEMEWTSGTVTSGSAIKSEYWVVCEGDLIIKSASYKEINNCGMASFKRALITHNASPRFTYNGRLVNYGNMSVDSSGTSFGYYYYYYYYYGSRYLGSLVNNGFLTIDAGTLSVTFYVELTGNGTVVVMSGTLALAMGSNFYNGSTLKLLDSASLSWQRGTHRFMPESQLTLSDGAKLITSGGVVNIDSNASASLNIPELSITSGSFTVTKSDSLVSIPRLTVTGGSAVLERKADIGLLTLNGGRITLSDRSSTTEVRMRGGTLSGGSAEKIAVLTVRDFTLGGGIVASAVSSKKRCYLNVTRSLTMNAGSSILDRCDLFNYGDATFQTSSSLTLRDDTRFVNTRKASLRLIHGVLTNRQSYYYWRRYSSSLVNFGTVIVETAGAGAQLSVETQFINTGGKVAIVLGVFNVYGGGLCNGTGSSINIDKGTSLMVTSNTFRCEATAFTGQGLIDIRSGTLQFTGGSLTVSVLIRGGTLLVPPQTRVRLSAFVRVISGTFTIHGNADIVSTMNLEGGTLNGNGILLNLKSGLYQVLGSSSIYVEIHNKGNVSVLSSVYVYSLLRNERGGLLHLYADGTFARTYWWSTAGHIENIGTFRCTDKLNQRCKTDIKFSNYGTVHVESGILELSYNPSLFDGGEVVGPGTLLTNTRLAASGIIRGTLVINGGMTIIAPLYNYGSLVWNSGSLNPGYTMCTDSSYRPPSSQIVPVCIEVFLLNSGMMQLATTNTKTLNGGLVITNRGDVVWSGGEFRMSGTFQNEKTGSVAVKSQTSRPLTFTGNLNSYGNMTITDSEFTVNGNVNNSGTMILDRAAVKISGNYEQTSPTSRVTIEQSTMRAVAVRITDGNLQGWGTIQGNVYNLGGRVEPMVLTEGLRIEGLFDQKSSASLVISLVQQAGVLKTSLVDVTRDVYLDGSLLVIGNAGNVTAGSVYNLLTFSGTRYGNITVTGVIPVSAVYQPGRIGIKFKY